MNHLRVIVLLILFVLALPVVVHAQEPEVISGTLFRAGEVVVVDEVVEGDVVCAGQSVTITGSVAGDVICAAQHLSIEGDVAGSVRAVAQNLNFAGLIGRNVTVFGQSITLSVEGSVDGEFLAGGQTILVNGVVASWVKAAAQTVFFNGQAGDDVYIAGEAVALGSDAVIDGSLMYESVKPATIDTGASIAGDVKHMIPKEEPKKKREFFTMKSWRSAGWPRNAIGPGLLFLAFGLLLTIVAPSVFPSVTGPMRQKPLLTLMLGLAGVIFVPFVLLVFILTIIGIPVAIVLGFLYALVLIVATLFSAVIVGAWILEAFASKKVKGNLVYQLLIGVPVTWLTLTMPLVGTVLKPLALFWGAGGIIMAIARAKRTGKK